MIQKLLADRFKLGFHRDKKELGVYAITVDKGGPKLTKNDTAGNSLPGIGVPGPRRYAGTQRDDRGSRQRFTDCGFGSSDRGSNGIAGSLRLPSSTTTLSTD
jgi:uncharacterized protein (TIGR03435 family)